MDFSKIMQTFYDLLVSGAKNYTGTNSKFKAKKKGVKGRTHFVSY